MELLKLITSNYLINVGFASWALAQILKTIFTFIKTDTFVAERLFGSGGMPSAHSATVCALTVGMARKVGFASPEFALAMILAAVVMYDAMGVRRAAGEQAKILNLMLFYYKKQQAANQKDLSKEIDSPEMPNFENHAPLQAEEKELKEFLGHTPLEVLGGALLGILVAMLLPVV